MLSERIYRELLERTLVLLEGLEDDRKRLLSYIDQSANPDVYNKIASANPPIIRWLSKNIQSKKTVLDGHPVDDIVQTVHNFGTIVDSVTAKWKRKEEPLFGGMRFIDIVRQKYQAANIVPTWKKAPVDWENSSTWTTSPVPDWSNLSLKEIEILAASNEVKKSKNKIAESGYVPKTLISKVGPWNIWVPDTKKDSIEIQGYNRDTLSPNTTWCTGRLDGSNLFYSYSHGANYLIYIIKDNPVPYPEPGGEFHYISLGVTDGKVEYAGRNGGRSINRENAGITKDILKGVFGEYSEEIFKIVEKYADKNRLSKTAIVFYEAMKNIEKAKDVLESLSKTEKVKMITDIMHQVPFSVANPSRDVSLYFLNSMNLIKNNKIDIRNIKLEFVRLLDNVQDMLVGIEIKNLQKMTEDYYLGESIRHYDSKEKISDFQSIFSVLPIYNKELNCLKQVTSGDLLEIIEYFTERLKVIFEKTTTSNVVKNLIKDILFGLAKIKEMTEDIYKKIQVSSREEWIEKLEYVKKNKLLDELDGIAFLKSPFASPSHFFECLSLLKNKSHMIKSEDVLRAIDDISEDYINRPGSIEKLFLAFDSRNFNENTEKINILKIAKKLRSSDQLFQLFLNLKSRNCKKEDAALLVSSLKKDNFQLFENFEKKINEAKWSLNNASFLESLGFKIDPLVDGLDELIDILEI